MILWLDYIFHVCIMNDDQTSSNSLTSSFPYRSLLSFPSPAHLNFHPHANLIEFHPARGSSFHTHHSHHTFHDRINHVQPVWRWWGWLFQSPSMYLFPLPSHILHWHSRMSPITSTATQRRPSVGLDFENSIDRYTELDWCDQNCAWNVLIFTSFVGYNVYKSSPNNIIARTQSPPPDWSSIYGRRPSQFNTIRVTRCPSSEGEGWQWNVSNSEQLMCVPCPSTDVPIDWIVQIYFHRALRNKESFLLLVSPSTIRLWWWSICTWTIDCCDWLDPWVNVIALRIIAGHLHLVRCLMDNVRRGQRECINDGLPFLWEPWMVGGQRHDIDGRNTASRSL